jgi:hypothetical protein
MGRAAEAMSICFIPFQADMKADSEVPKHGDGSAAVLDDACCNFFEPPVRTQ